MESNIVDLGLVSEILLKDGRVSFSITVPADRAAELEPLRQAAEKIVREMEGVTVRPGRADGGEAARSRTAATAARRGAQVPESARVQEARAAHPERPAQPLGRRSPPPRAGANVHRLPASST